MTQPDESRERAQASERSGDAGRPVAASVGAAGASALQYLALNLDASPVTPQGQPGALNGLQNVDPVPLNDINGAPTRRARRKLPGGQMVHAAASTFGEVHYRQRLVLQDADGGSFELPPDIGPRDRIDIAPSMVAIGTSDEGRAIRTAERARRARQIDRVVEAQDFNAAISRLPLADVFQMAIVEAHAYVEHTVRTAVRPAKARWNYYRARARHADRLRSAAYQAAQRHKGSDDGRWLDVGHGEVVWVDHYTDARASHGLAMWDLADSDRIRGQYHQEWLAAVRQRDAHQEDRREWAFAWRDEVNEAIEADLVEDTTELQSLYAIPEVRQARANRNRTVAVGRVGLRRTVALIEDLKAQHASALHQLEALDLKRARAYQHRQAVRHADAATRAKAKLQHQDSVAQGREQRELTSAIYHARIAAGEERDRFTAELVTAQEAFDIARRWAYEMGLVSLPTAKTGNRQAIKGFSSGSRRNMLKAISQADLENLLPHPDSVMSMTTLGLPGMWQQYAPTRAAWNRLVDAFRARLERYWRGQFTGALWKLEFQPRVGYSKVMQAAPHLHLAHAYPIGLSRCVCRGEHDDDSTCLGFLDYPTWVAQTWTALVNPQSDKETRDHLHFGTCVSFGNDHQIDNPISVARYFAKHGLFASKEAQHTPPDSWIENGGVGRYWGRWRIKKVVASSYLQGDEKYRALRIMRKVARSKRVLVYNENTKRPEVRPVMRTVVRQRELVDLQTGEVRTVTRRMNRRTKPLRGRGGFLVLPDGPAFASQLQRALRPTPTGTLQERLRLIDVPTSGNRYRTWPSNAVRR